MRLQQKIETITPSPLRHCGYLTIGIITKVSASSAHWGFCEGSTIPFDTLVTGMILPDPLRRYFDLFPTELVCGTDEHNDPLVGARVKSGRGLS